jgi:hypothetical protein
MRKHLVTLLFAASISPLSAASISFLTFAGVDGYATAPGSSPANLGVQTLSLLSGQLELNAMSNYVLIGGDGNLTYRANRGLGVAGGTQDQEVDNFGIGNSLEWLELNVLSGSWMVSQVELRSLFRERICLFGCTTYDERARVRIYNGLAYTDYDVQGTTDPNGIAMPNLGAPQQFTSIRFYVPDGVAFSGSSEFSLASLDVNPLEDTATPEPAAGIMLISGLGLVMLARRRIINK